MVDNPNKNTLNPKTNLAILEDTSWKQVEKYRLEKHKYSVLLVLQGKVEVLVVAEHLLSSKAEF